MKKYVLLVLLMLFSGITSAASLSISNPVATTGVSNASVGVDQFAFGGDFATVLFNEDFDLFDQFSVSLDLKSSISGFAKFNIALTLLDEWNISIVGADNSTVFSGSGIGFQSVNVDTKLMQSQALYNLVITGNSFLGSNSLRGLEVFITEIQVSEVPLPAAFWLFGTALMGGLAFRRNRMKKLSAQAA